MVKRSCTAARSSILIGFLFATVTACGNSDAPATDGAAAAANQSVDEQLADISRYELTMDKVDKYAAAQRNIANRMKSMSPAEREALDAQSQDGADANASIDDMTRRIESVPQMAAAIREAGLSPREFTLITISMMQTAMAAAVAKMRPNDNQDSLAREMKANPANIRFYNQNEAAITQKMKSLEADMKAAGVSEN